MRKFILIAFAAIISTPALAYEVDTRCTYSRFYGTSSCHTSEYMPAPEDPAIAAEDARIAAEHEAKWTAFCKPHPGPADLATGMRHMIYAQQGCNVGRTE
jgi:hypothetical protein